MSETLELNLKQNMPYNKSKKSYSKSYEDLGRTQKWKRFNRQKKKTEKFSAALHD